MITLQQIFNKAWTQFIEKNDLPATNDVGLAKYLDHQGRRCAVGLCLPDDHPALHSGRRLSSLVKTYPALFSKQVRLMDPKRLDEFQRCLHDDLVEIGDSNTWKYDLDNRRQIYRNVASMYGLKVPSGVAA